MMSGQGNPTRHIPSFVQQFYQHDQPLADHFYQASHLPSYQPDEQSLGYEFYLSAQIAGLQPYQGARITTGQSIGHQYYQPDLLANPQSYQAEQTTPYQPAEPRLPSVNYQGDFTNPHNHSATIDPNESSSLYLTHLPPDITVTTLLDTIYLSVPELDDRIFTCC
ncbi:uncharacterized protein PODANS_2_7735 [Podospora anserina S mat+]|uniref:Podospora anserina S mat+ genomic DNA chromosome 2, supercontig 2 n=1 Tax=Podospora anserina (strain S / ATCC MYA-4624 / DSM 980 / FGSC 10383) TaxID=515849 RepID=B2B6G5_PODAN|nr:uncharacterized protein PODANS_2_7735 [Podospora anserina S mat+]CAP73391.1 unnamed protein product [Podospora anserina S mat+]CDP25793.1 Putative protein of unknown function [Podospora anserina S mat+]